MFPVLSFVTGWSQPLQHDKSERRGLASAATVDSACPDPTVTNRRSLDEWNHNRHATGRDAVSAPRSEEHTSELQSLMRISYAVFCLKKKKSHKQVNLTQYVTNNQLLQNNIK